MNVTKLYDDSVFDEKKNSDGYNLYAIISDKEQYHTDEKGNKFVLLELNQTKKVSSGVKLDERIRHRIENVDDSGFTTKECKEVPYTEELWLYLTNESDEDIKIYSGDVVGRLVESEKTKTKEEKEEEEKE